MRGRNKLVALATLPRLACQTCWRRTGRGANDERRTAELSSQSSAPGDLRKAQEGLAKSLSSSDWPMDASSLARPMNSADQFCTRPTRTRPARPPSFPHPRGACRLPERRRPSTPIGMSDSSSAALVWAGARELRVAWLTGGSRAVGEKVYRSLAHSLVRSLSAASTQEELAVASPHRTYTASARRTQAELEANIPIEPTADPLTCKQASQPTCSDY